MNRACHKNVQEAEYFGIVKGLLKSIPQLTVLLPIYLIYKYTQLICHPTVRTYDVPIGTCIQSSFTFFNSTFIRGFTSYFNVIYSTSSYPLGSPIKSIFPPVSFLKYIFSIFRSAV